ncbi:MAG: aldo/keto reductase [Nostoc sp. DedQUE12b]|uniref:aldo/keto reductase n=1 Tax=Nostoc sp. DedQUE12b TaxID=3075398 RepID=UPI002AD441E4|nr:aldo/keto reductase [Nostoc sp. DedQUE12b]MDZ8085254.1 aldo/keto reductase [Nostoc sp. DedQUE12b]
MKLGIGTAQFGLDYGISNQEGKTPTEEVAKIIELAGQNGIQVLDTAPAYGTSEEILGKLIPDNHNFEIVTKTPKFSSNCITSDDVKLLENTFYQSLSTLNQSSIYGLLIHQAKDLLANNGQSLMEKMLHLKEKKMIKKIGVSVYSQEEIESVLEKYPIDLIQLPINVLDQRLLLSGNLSYLKKNGIEIHARSIFFQGLLLMEPESLPSYFDSIKNHLKKYHEMLSQYNISPLQASISFIKNIQEIDSIVIGINNIQHLSEILLAFKASFFLEANVFLQFALTDNFILNPTNWKF